MTGNGLNRHSLLFFARGGSRRQVGVSMVRSDSSPALHLSGRLHECGGEPGVPGRPQSSLSQVPGPGTARPFPVRGYPSRVTHTGRTGQVDADAGRAPLRPEVRGAVRPPPGRRAPPRPGPAIRAPAPGLPGPQLRDGTCRPPWRCRGGGLDPGAGGQSESPQDLPTASGSAPAWPQGLCGRREIDG